MCEDELSTGRGEQTQSRVQQDMSSGVRPLISSALLSGLIKAENDPPTPSVCVCWGKGLGVCVCVCVWACVFISFRIKISIYILYKQRESDRESEIERSRICNVHPSERA